MITELTVAEVSNLRARHRDGHAALMAVVELLYAVEPGATLSPAAIELCATKLGLTRAFVVAFSEEYIGRHLRHKDAEDVEVCAASPCGLLGGDEILLRLSDASSRHIRGVPCLGQCSLAPAIRTQGIIRKVTSHDELSALH